MACPCKVRACAPSVRRVLAARLSAATPAAQCGRGQSGRPGQGRPPAFRARAARLPGLDQLSRRPGKLRSI